MVTYIGIVFFTIFIYVLYNQNVSQGSAGMKDRRNSNKLVIFITACILIFFAGGRYKVGADYGQYAANYTAYCSAELDLLGEPGIRIIAIIAKILYDDYSVMFFLMSCLTVGLCIYGIAKNSPFWAVSIILYIFLGAWHESFNSVRQSAAAAILFAGHRCVTERKLTKWLIVCAAATMFHISAIIFIPFYWMPMKQVNIKKIVLFFIVGILLAFGYDKIWGLIGFLQGKEHIVDMYSLKSINIFRIIVAWVPITFYMLFVKPNVGEAEQKEMNFYAMLSLTSGAIMLAARNSAYLGRMVIYTDIYNVIFWAYMFVVLFRKEHWNAGKAGWLLVILGCYFAYYLFEASGAYLVNYQTVFSR